MARAFSSFVGVDLGGGRGKTTAVAQLRSAANGSGVEVVEVATRARGHAWTDDTLAEHFAVATPGRVIAIDAPLAPPACARCTLPACPGMEACVDPSVVWLRTEGRASMASAQLATGSGRTATTRERAVQARLAPYAHRATDVVMVYERGLLPPSSLGSGHGAIAARAGQLRKRFAGAGFTLHDNLIEVSPQATIAALCGPRVARGYKRDADPWRTRALVLEQLGDLAFAPVSRMAREDVLRNDHCFDALIAAYTAYLWARDDWQRPAGIAADDGWIYAP